MLGDLRVCLAGKALALPPSRKTRALLGHLAILGRPQSRQRLCDLLWDGPADPRGGLRWSLARLRPLLDGDRRRLVADKESAAVVLGEGELDLAMARSIVAGGVRAASVEALRRAAALFRGELLEGIELPDAFRYHEWLVAEREAARRLRLEILDALVEKLDGAPEDALAFARARVDVDPLAEAGHVTVVRLLGRLGRRREALEQYNACRRILGSALGARPSAALERARLSLTAPAAETPAPAPAVVRSETPAPAPVPFVGRERERAEIARIVAAVRTSGRCHLLEILGEPGIGKSRLLHEVASSVAAAGGLALSGRSFEAEVLRPYGPWLDALRAAPLATLTEIQRAEIAPLLPELGPPGPATDQGRLFDGVARALATFAANRTVALLLDDVHWLDEPSAALLHYAVRALDAAPVLFALAVRPGEIADNPAALRIARALAHVKRTVRLELGPLPPGDIRALLGSEAPALDADRVHAETEGNPLYALELARAAREGGGAASLEALLGDRLARVTGRARELIPWAAALGRSFPAERLLRVSGAAPSELLASVEELERRGILRPSGEGAYDFTHDLVRRAAYQTLSAPRRRLLHREIARALAPLPDPDGALAGEVFHHAALGDEPELAAQTSIAAGARAVRLFAIAEGREIVTRGLRFAERLPTARRVKLSLALFRVLVDAHRTLGGDPTLAPRILALVDEARREGLHAEVAAGHAIAAHASYAAHRVADAAASSEQMLDELRGLAPSAAAEAMAEVGACLVIVERELPRARVLLDEAKRVGELPARTEVYLATGIGILQHLEGAAAESVATLEGALRIVEAAPWEECAILSRLALLDLELGRPARAMERATRIRAASPRLGDPGDTLFADALERIARRAAGEPIAEGEVERALAALEVDAKLRFAQLACAAAEQDLRAGRLVLARGRCERARAAGEAVERPSVVVLAHAIAARAALRAGDRAAAAAEVDAGRRALTSGVPSARAARILDEVARELGQFAIPLPPPQLPAPPP